MEIKKKYPNVLSSAVSKKCSQEQDDLDILIRKIFEIIDTYYIEWQAEEIKHLIQGFVEQQVQVEEIKEEIYIPNNIRIIYEQE